MRSAFRQQLKSRTMRQLASCLLLLASCRGFILKKVSTSKIRTEGQPSPFNSQPKIAPKIETVLLSTKDINEETVIKDEKSNNTNNTAARSSFWKPKASWWKERVLLEDLEIGQELSGHVVQEYLEAKTGPKLYFECGVGRTDQFGNWSIVNGMLRLDRGKASVARKRAARFRKKDDVQLFVSRVQKECGRLEVCAKIEDVQKYVSEPKISVTMLKKNQEVVGRVVKLHPYGAIIDIGANVKGLLHITKVASVMNRYIDKEKGLKSAGLEKGAKVRLMVESIEKRRLSLDFTEDVKETARQEKVEEKEPAKEQQQLSGENNYSQEELDTWAEYANEEAMTNKQQQTVGENNYSQDELDAWAEYADQETPTEKSDEQERDDEDDDEDDDDDYEYDQYDEEMDIESSLGLDMY